MAEVEVHQTAGGTYSVTVTEGASASTHEVAVAASDVDRLAGDRSAVDLVEASFRFLLDREPKESILPRFELSVIERYFPEYPHRISDYL